MNIKKSSNKKNQLVKKEVLGIPLTDASANEVLEYIFDTIVNTEENFYIVTPNPEMVVRAQEDKEFRDILNQAEVSLCDGTGLYLASKFLQQRVKERISGVEFVKKICEKSGNQPITIGFLGGRDKVAELTADRLQQDYPGLKVVFAGEEWNEKRDSKEYVVGRNKSRSQLPTTNYQLPTEIDILFVAFGAPKQEIWMRDQLGKIPVRVMMGVGGAFDEISGKVTPCPERVDRMGFKWLWRLVHEPWRWRRQIALIEFVWLVIEARVKGKASRGK